MTREIDITEMVFPLRELTPEEKREEELWGLANEEAYKLVGPKSPITLIHKTEEIYNKYLRQEKK